jgi:hypothetical protein
VFIAFVIFHSFKSVFSIRAAKYCNVPPRTIQHIRNEGNNCVVDGGLSTSGKTLKLPNI